MYSRVYMLDDTKMMTQCWWLETPRRNRDVAGRAAPGVRATQEYELQVGEGGPH